MEYGLLGIGEKETDFKFGADVDLIDILEDKDLINRQPRFEYNQGAQPETAYYCTIYSAITELSYLFDREYSLTEIKEIGNRMMKDGKLDPSYGAYLSDAIDYTRRWQNENFPDKQVKSYQIDYTDIELNKVLTHDRVRLTQIGYKTSPELKDELETKGFASKKDYPKKGGHAVSKYGLNIIDNYKGKKKNNRYSFQYLQDLIKNGVIFQKGYLFLKV